MDASVKLVFGKKVELKNITSLKNVVFPKECDIISLPLVEELENITFPEECTVIYLESCKRIKNVRFPKSCNEMYLNSLESLDGIKLPDYCDYINLSSIKILENCTFGKYDCICMDSCISIKNVKFTKFEELYLKSIKLLNGYENIKFPQKCNFIDLGKCEKVENIIFPECNEINLEKCTTLKKVVFPKKIDFLFLNSLETREETELPEECLKLELSW